MEQRLLAILGSKLAARFWALYEVVREETDVGDFVETVRRLREEFPADATSIDAASDALFDWDFCPRLYPRAIETILHLKTLGQPIIVSDGDPVFQPSKIHQCGITEAVDGRVL